MVIRRLPILFSFLFALATQLSVTVTVFADTETSWKKQAEEAKVAFSCARATARQQLIEVLANKPADADPLLLGELTYDLAVSTEDHKEAIGLCKKAEEYFARASKPTDELLSIYAWISFIGEGQEACDYAGKAVSLYEQLHGRNFGLASYLLSYAKAASGAGNNALANKSIEEALDIIGSGTLDQRRYGETKDLIRIGEHYEANKDYKLAEKYYRKAIYTGETLWYPLYDLNLSAIMRLAQLYKSMGRKTDSEKQFARIQNIQDTGKDPEGKDVCKFWNGENAPDNHVTAIINRRRNFPPPKLERSPRDIYQRTYFE